MRRNKTYLSDFEISAVRNAINFAILSARRFGGNVPDVYLRLRKYFADLYYSVDSDCNEILEISIIDIADKNEE